MTKEEFLLKAASRYDELSALNKINSFYDYEKEFDRIWSELGKDVLQQNISNIPGDRRKKNFNQIWRDRDRQ